MLLPAAACAWPHLTAIPDTHTLQAWLNAFNGGDRTRHPGVEIQPHAAGRQNLGFTRAAILGETTGGGAPPVCGHRIDDHFLSAFARAVNPIFKTNWEGTGFEPDVKVSADQALDVAQTMATEQIKNDQSKKK